MAAPSKRLTWTIVALLVCAGGAFKARVSGEAGAGAVPAGAYNARIAAMSSEVNAVALL